MTPESCAESLEELAHVLGVTRSYHDGVGEARRASDEALVAVLRALGAPLERIEDAPEALRAVRARAAAESRSHVLVAGRGGQIAAHDLAEGGARARLVFESAETARLEIETAEGSARVTIPPGAPAGYHRLEIEHGGRLVTHRLIVAPPSLPQAPRGWGLFAPLYSLRSGGSEAGGISTYADLARLASWMTEATTGPAHGCAGSSQRRELAWQPRDAAWLGTLPLLACFFEEPFEPSPYSPISRAFWSELYVDPRRTPEHDGSGLAIAAPEAAARPTGRDPIDYRLAMRERRAAIELLLANLERRGGRRREDFEAALEDDDELCRYAAFRACVEREGRPWHEWPAREQGGRLRPGSDFDGGAFRYHAYAQWLAREQLAEAAEASPAGLYLDLPLGSHGGGYDTWRHAGEYAFGVSAGAPPDAVFAGGQDWAFPPMHPGRARDAGYAGLRAALAHHFAHACMLRVDHVMSLHRLFWIPEGFTPADGVYVRYPADDLWSVLAIEAARARGGRGAAVVGEDLGTVPDEVRAEMDARGALRMYVVPFEVRGDAQAPLAEPPERSLACLGTHDMEPYASWWEGLGDRRADIAAFVGSPSDGAFDVLPALLEWLAAGRATVVFANLEDFWLEPLRQNLPGTTAAAGTNWKRRFARETSDFMNDGDVKELVRALRGGEAS